MQIHAHTRRPRRVLACLAMLAALLMPTALAAAASARSSAAHHNSCPSRHARHASAKHCSRHRSHKPSHKTKKPAPKPAVSPPKPAAALCDDASAPARPAEGGEYLCEDGSEPFCEDGSEPIEPSSGPAPVCPAPQFPAECGTEAECGPELACESAEETFAGPQGCEHGSALEEEIGEPA